MGDTSAGHQALLMLLLTQQSCSGKADTVVFLAPCLGPSTSLLAPAHQGAAQPRLGGTCWQGLWPGSGPPPKKGLQGAKGLGCFHSPVAWWGPELGVHSKEGGFFPKRKKKKREKNNLICKQAHL